MKLNGGHGREERNDVFHMNYLRTLLWHLRVGPVTITGVNRYISNHNLRSKGKCFLLPRFANISFAIYTIHNLNLLIV